MRWEHHTDRLSEEVVNYINQQLTEEYKELLGNVLYGFYKSVGEEVVTLLLIGSKTMAILEKEW